MWRSLDAIANDVGSAGGSVRESVLRKTVYADESGGGKAISKASASLRLDPTARRLSMCLKFEFYSSANSPQRKDLLLKSSMTMIQFAGIHNF